MFSFSSNLSERGNKKLFSFSSNLSERRELRVRRDPQRQQRHLRRRQEAPLRRGPDPLSGGHRVQSLEQGKSELFFFKDNSDSKINV